MEGKTCSMCAKGSKRCAAHMVGYVLVIIGAINWGLIGLGGLLDTNLNVVNLVFGSVSWLESIIYLVVGLAAIALLVGCRCKKCSSCCHDGATEVTSPMPGKQM